MRHLWYLTPDTVVFCLFDPETSDVEKREVARAIVHTPYPATIQLGKPHMPVLMPAIPSLASFVGTDSWKLWELLGVGHAWLWQPVHQWSRSNDYNVAEQFARGLTVVNDGAERCVCAITDFAQVTGDSIYQEDILLIGNFHQEVFQDLQKAALARLKPLDISVDLQFGTFMCHCIMELHMFVTNDRYTIWICDKNTHVWVLKSQFHKNY